MKNQFFFASLVASAFTISLANAAKIDSAAYINDDGSLNQEQIQEAINNGTDAKKLTEVLITSDPSRAVGIVTSIAGLVPVDQVPEIAGIAAVTTPEQSLAITEALGNQIPSKRRTISTYASSSMMMAQLGTPATPWFGNTGSTGTFEARVQALKEKFDSVSTGSSLASYARDANADFETSQISEVEGIAVEELVIFELFKKGFTPAQVVASQAYVRGTAATILKTNMQVATDSNGAINQNVNLGTVAGYLTAALGSVSSSNDTATFNSSTATSIATTVGGQINSNNSTMITINTTAILAGVSSVVGQLSP